ncbi:hypothetical protein N8I77_012124 [Diaporthe amygdali]|uniref:Uncharacterized protein n=1 Tax=Phomopsis amygdali TaxID=1214568 RepID=A0AAD9S5I4_PHOAM|nr:hypothetical protein N8I77_012124 [Diaporthe amygdali]
MSDRKDSEKGSGELCREPQDLSLSADNDFSRVSGASGPYHPLKFMEFPREIRNAIYKQSLAYPDGVFIIGSNHCIERGRRRAVLGHRLSPFMPLSGYTAEFSASTRNLAILRTSKTISAEVGKILYGEPLVFTEMVALQSFPTGLSQEKISLLRHVAVDDDVFGIYDGQQDVMPSVFALLKDAGGLENLRIPAIVPSGPCSGPALTVTDAEWTEERKVAMKKVMAEEIARLLEADKN